MNQENPGKSDSNTVIIYRYFAREVLITTLIVTIVVLVIALGWRFSGYLNEAARGTLTKDVLFLIMGYRLPGFLELIIPVSFFLAIMLAYGRLHVDSEMVVLEACGMSQTRLVLLTLGMAAVVMVVTAGVSLWAKPYGEHRVERLLQGQMNMTEFDTLAPGRFQTLRSGKRVTYTEEVSSEGGMQQVFINEYKETNFFGRKDVNTVVSESGVHQVDEVTGNRFLVLKNGRRYSGLPGNHNYQVIDYEEYGQLIEKDSPRARKARRTAIPTIQLLAEPTPRNLSEFQWRISMIILVPVVALLAVPLSRVNPRQGRFTRIVPGLLLFFIYIVSLSSGRAAVEKEQISVELGIWWVHGVFILLALVMLSMGTIRRRWLNS